MSSPPPPPSKRERLARLISRARSKRSSASSLVVQTGFPTSLADLVVKNRDKFRKRRKSPPSSVAARSESDSGRSPAAETPNLLGEDVETPPAAAAVVRVRRRRVEFGLGFLLPTTAVLVVLAVGRRWVVAGITVLTFWLLALEFWGFVRPRSRERDLIEEVEENERNNSLRTDVEALDLRGRGRGLASPIREIEPACRQNVSLSDSRNGNLTGGRVTIDSTENDINSSSSRESKRKKLFRKIFRRKSREKRDEMESSSSLDSNSVHNELVVEEQDGITGENSDDEEYFSSEANFDKVTPVEGEGAGANFESGWFR